MASPRPGCTGDLRRALAAEISPRATRGLDEEILGHLALQLAGDEVDEEALVEAWSPFLVNLGACDDRGCRAVCGRVLARLREGRLPAAVEVATPSVAAATSSRSLPAPVAEEEEELSEEIASWLERLRLGQYLAKAREWCNRMGAVHVAEVLECWDDFATDLRLKPLERKRVEKASRDEGSLGAVAATPPVGSSATSPRPAAAAPAASPAGAGARPADSGTGACGAGAAGSPEAAAPSFYLGPKDDPRRYAVMEELGQGATAIVHRCVCGKETYAVKTISLAKLRLQPGFQRIADKMRREVSILFALRHPRIVSLFDVIEVPDSTKPEKLHLVMDFVQGGELFDKIVEAGAFKEPVARYVFLQIAEGLKYIHSKDIVYRDLKPENVLVDEKASRSELIEVKLSDFGHSKLINDGYSTALTRVGTPQYWAPEVSDPAKAALGYDFTVDLWSLGVVLYVMLIGAYPFDGVGCPIEDQIKKAQVPFRVNAHGLEVTEPAKELVRSLVKVHPKERLPLENCLTHPWVSREGGSINRLLKLCTEADPQISEERIQLPCHPSKDQVETLRRDLHMWMTKFHCSAKLVKDEIVASLGNQSAQLLASARSELRQIVEFNLGSLSSASLGSAAPAGYPQSRIASVREEAGRGVTSTIGGRSFRMLNLTLRVHEEHGAGLDLQPERGGMRVEGIYDPPGQAGLQRGDLITKINEVVIRGTLDRVEEIFGQNFGDGAQLSVRRAC